MHSESRLKTTQRDFSEAQTWKIESDLTMEHDTKEIFSFQSIGSKL